MRLLTIIAVFVLLSLAFAQTLQSSSGKPPEKFTGQIEVVKSAPESVKVTDEFTVSIALKNLGSQTASIVVHEFLANVDAVDPMPENFNINESVTAAMPPRLSWNVTLASGGVQTLTYRVRPKTVGTLSLGSTEVIVPGAKFFSNSLIVQVECSDAVGCDESIGETPLTCANKCGGNASEVPPEPPDQQLIYTPPIPGPNMNAKNEPPPKELVEEKTKPMIFIYAAIAIILVAAAYFIYTKMKKPPAKGIPSQ
jgi:hypothetical protein